jgi:hypothetical protein
MRSQNEICRRHGSQRVSQRPSSLREICLSSPDLCKVADAAAYQCTYQGRANRD